MLRIEAKLFIVTTLLAIVAAQPVENTPQIIKYDNVNDGLGSYSFEFETTDGTKRQEVGRFVNDPSLKEPVLIVEGSYVFQGSDGFIYTVTYTADENGYHPVVQKMPLTIQYVGVSPGIVASLLG